MVETPEWVKHAIFYQIFPDRFARSQRLQHARGTRLKPWGSDPREQGFQGGDLLGVVERLDYLQDLGINALYLNPIFASASNHRYHTFDYFQVDPLLGGDAALRELLDAAHARDMRVVLDGVFNHASRGFWPFHHVLECGADSPYLDWFHIHDWPLRPYHSDGDNPANYSAWFDLPMLPKLNTANPGVRDMIFACAEHWLRFGIDGWRLDVPQEIDDDDFWREFRRRVKGINPDAWICGEIWGDARRWLAGDMFDAVMNYLFSRATLSFVGGDTLRPDYRERPDFQLEPLDAAAMASHIEAMLALYPWAVNQVQMNLLGSHDTARALWIMGEERSALKLAVFLQMTLPGAPCLYYGDEIGLSAGDDPDCREAFPWEATERWDRALLDYYRKVTALRHAHPVLRLGDYRTIHTVGQVYGFARRLGNQQALVLVNAGGTPTRVDLATVAPTSPGPRRIWPETSDALVDDLTIPAREGVVLLGESANLA